MFIKRVYLWKNSLGSWRYEAIAGNNKPVDQEYKSFATKWSAKRHIKKMWGADAPIVEDKPKRLR